VQVGVVGEPGRLYQVAVGTWVVADVGRAPSSVEELFGARHALIMA
jgi:hypothetical protein